MYNPMRFDCPGRMTGEDHLRTGRDLLGKSEMFGPWKTEMPGIILEAVHGGARWQGVPLAGATAYVQMVVAALRVLMSPTVATVGVLVD